MPSDRGGTNVPWPVAVSFLIRPLPETFSLAEVYADRPILSARRFPKTATSRRRSGRACKSSEIAARSRSSGGGRYRKLQADARRSVRLDFREAARYTSASQVARVAVEAWVANERRVLALFIIAAARATEHETYGRPLPELGLRSAGEGYRWNCKGLVIGRCVRPNGTALGRACAAGLSDRIVRSPQKSCGPRRVHRWRCFGCGPAEGAHCAKRRRTARRLDRSNHRSRRPRTASCRGPIF